MTAGPIALSAERLSKAYASGTRAVGPVDLRIEAGALTAVIGRSGCGKSTLLRCLAGLERPSVGAIKYGPGMQSAIGYAFQEPRLLPWLDVAANVGLGLRRLARPRRRALVEEALQVVGLAGAARLLPKQLSGGMAQRAALARALAPHPALLLLDEPFSALDPLTRSAMQAHLTLMLAHYRPTVVLVTHDMEEALLLARRIVVLRGAPGLVAGELEPNLPPGLDRTGTAFQRWKRQLIALLADDDAAATAAA